jgi:hypothetical protein
VQSQKDDDERGTVEVWGGRRCALKVILIYV